MEADMRSSAPISLSTGIEYGSIRYAMAEQVFISFV